MKKITVSILTTLLMLSMVFSSSVFAATEEVSAWDSFLGLFGVNASETTDVGVEYRGHIQNIGNYPLDGTWIQGPTELGTEGKSLRLEGFWIQLDGDVPADAHIEYQVHVQNVGWMDPVQDGEFAGTEGKSQQIEAIKISLVDDEGVQLEDYSVVYTGHVQNKGDVGPYTNGEQLGTDGEFLRLEAITVEIVQNEADLTEYEAALAAVTQADYTAASWTAYQAVVNANVVDEDNLQSEVDAATAAIVAAQANLVKVLKVESVSAINAKQITVTFTTPVDETTAKDVTNYSLKRAGSAAVALTTGTATSTLSADAKTVTITLTTSLTSAGNVFGAALVNGDIFQVTTANVKDVAKTQTVATSTKDVTYSDTTAPTLVSATSSAKTTTKTINLVFSEPIDVTAATVTINGSAAIVAAGTELNAAVITSVTNLVPGTTYTLSLLNFRDVAGNLTTENPIATTVTVSADTVAPVITNVNVVRNSSIEVTFDKDMTASTITTGSLRVLTSDLAATGITTTGVAAKVTNGVTSKTTFVITLAGLPYNSSNVFTGVLAYTSAIQDASGNAMVAGTTAITTSKDTTKPAYVSASYKNVSNYNGIATVNGAIVVKFSEPITTNVAGYTIINDLGVSGANTVVGPAINPNDTTELVLPLGSAIATTAKTYTVVMAASVVKDLSIEANTNLAANTSAIDVTAGAPIADDTTKPAIAFSAVTAATSGISGSTFVITATDAGSGVASATLLNTANYKLDGAALPAGSYVTLTGTSASYTATIHIPAGTITADATKVLNVNGIADAAGNINDPFIDSTNIALLCDVQPVLNTAVINTGGTISLGFSQDVIAVAGGTAADFVIAVNGTTVPTAEITFANGAGSDAGKYVATIGGYVDSGLDGLAATTADNRIYINCTGGATTGYVAGTDILITTGTTTLPTNNTTPAAIATVDTNLASTLTVSSVASPATVVNIKTLGLALVGSTTINVK